MASSAGTSIETASSVNPPLEAVAFDSGDSREKIDLEETIRKEIDKLDISQLPPMEADAFDSGDSLDIESILEEIDKLDTSLLPQELQSIDKRDLKQKFSNAKKSISILVTGKTGSGKSTLINGILGLDVEGKKSAKEGHDLEACTTKLEAYQENKGGINVTIWDSPGLQDGTENQDEYLKEMEEKCFDRDLTMYCIKIAELRLVSENDEVRAMKKFTKAFGHDFWKTTIIVLTFANIFELIHKEWTYLPEEDKPMVYKKKIQQWRERIREILTKDINVPSEIVKAIRIVPAGYYKEPDLPGYKFWLSNLLLHCIGTISTFEGQAALVIMNAYRFKKEEDATEEDFTNPIEQQPIFAAMDIKRGAKEAGRCGAAVGAAVGAVGLIAGPLGLITIPVFAAVGGGISYGIPLVIYLLANKIKKRTA